MLFKFLFLFSREKIVYFLLGYLLGIFHHIHSSRENFITLILEIIIYIYIYIYIFVVLLSPNQRLRNVNEMIIIIIITFGWRQGSRDNDDNNKRITNASLEDVSPRFSHRCKRCGHFPRLAEHNGGFRMAPRLPSYSSL